MAIDLKLNSIFKEDSFIKAFSKNFLSESPVTSDDYELITQPFPCIVFRNLVENAEHVIPLIEKSVKKCTFRRKNNDLYTFQQTEDFKKSPMKVLRSVRSFFLSTVLQWLTDCTKLSLQKDSIDIGCSRYKRGDVLLCHNDELEGRLLAFVWYLVPQQWEESDGGHLDLFSSDELKSGLPSTVSLLPRRNSLVLFEVTPRSWHQVREVLSESRTRYSINGWFHGPQSDPFPVAEFSRPSFLSPTEIDEQLLYGWVRPHYLTYDVQSEIHDCILEDSHVLLTDFLFEEKYNELQKAVQSQSIPWKRLGPHTQRRFDVPDVAADDLPDPVRAVMRLFSSEAMMVILADMTGLDLHFMAQRLKQEAEEEEEEEEEEDKEEGSTSKQRDIRKRCDDDSDEPKCKRRRSSGDRNGTESKETGKGDAPQTGSFSGQLRRWSHTCYTLLSDCDLPFSALVCSFFLGCESWSEKMGGFHSYIAKGENEELLCVEPVANALACVYRDEETLQFVKYINGSINDLGVDAAFYEFAFLYMEPEDE